MIPIKPFQNICLTFSGGGFRAAAYSLGVLSYLDHLKKDDGSSILDNVSFITSTSGGTITNTIYSLGKHRGESFEQIFNNIYNGLQGEKIVDEALKILNDDKQWSKDGTGKRRTLINAFAKAYDELLFSGASFGELFSNTDKQVNLDACFNSTEFFRGLSFRFQTDGKIGNKYLYFDSTKKEDWKKIKLADILAASSCFPLGFEPIVYPSDFSYLDKYDKLSESELRKSILYEDYENNINQLQEIKEVTSDKTIEPIYEFGLMDGGIADNQGVYSAMLADDRRRNSENKINKPAFDLFIICDVASYFLDAYKIPKVKMNNFWLNRNLFDYLFGIVSLLCCLSFGISIFLTCNNLLKIFFVLVCGISFILIIIILLFKNSFINKIISYILKNKLKLENFFAPTIVSRLASFLSNTKLGVLQQMILNRALSVKTMVMDINLQQVRRLIYDQFYANEDYKCRRVSNYIYELSTYNKKARENRLNDPNRKDGVFTEEDKKLLLEGMKEIHIKAEEARTMDTTLWFDKTNQKDQKLDKIIATGQFTTCVNLLKYIISLERKPCDNIENTGINLNKLKQKLIEDLDKFKDDPIWLANQKKP